MKLFEILEKQLKSEPNFVSDSGELKKWVVITKAQNFDEDLISLLLEDKELKEKFFLKVKGALVFNLSLFIQFFEQKNYLNDSYTAYKNKVGLNIDGKYIKQNNDVSLVWPYKDCILEGGQSREEDKRDEIFFNEVLAQDEINQLLNPKILTNVKFITSSKEIPFDIKEKNFWKLSSNYLINGNNLLVSSSLSHVFRNRIKLIYLDPPYNTPGEANTFSYNNSFNHSTWLTFMKNRIEIASDLVSDDGFICLAIDDVEYAYLKVMCDDILGRDNFLATVVVQIKKEGRTDSEFFATSHDYCLFYCKDKNKAKLNKLYISEEKSRKWKENDSTGRFYWRDFVRTGGNSTPIARPNQDYIIYYSQNKKEIIGVGGFSEKPPEDLYYSNKVFIIDNDGQLQEISNEEFCKVNKDIIEYYPKGSKGERQVWRWSDREKVLWAAKLGEINLIDNKIKIKDRIRQGSKPTTTWYDSDFNATSHGTLLLKKLFNGKKVFSYPKSLYTMIDIVQITTNSDSEDIVLDMFGGSATTAQAVNRVNEFDNGNRSFIIIEQMDYIHNATLPRIKKCLNKVNDDSFVYLELKKYNHHFIEQIEKAKSTKALLIIWEDMKSKSFLNYNVDIKKHDEHINEFKSLSLEEQKQHLLEILDKNQLYVNISSMDDKDFKVTPEEKKVTIEFYNLNK
ncbi:MAG: site-specific DNA-methyltransferase [Ignavibacteria bacterium]